MSLKVSLNNAKSFSELKPIVDKARIGLSFWGHRYIIAIGYSGSLHIDALAARVIKLANNCKFNFSDSERMNGQFIASRINRIYN